MKKVCLLMFAAVLMISGCTKVNTNKLQGFWSTDPVYGNYHGYGWCQSRGNCVLNFINQNTVFQYIDVIDKYETEYDHTTSVPNHSGWYCKYSNTLTYVFEDNKVLLSNGWVFTYMNGKLYQDNSSVLLSPW